MAFDVLLAVDATRDIEDIYRYIAAHDDIVNADRVLLALEDMIAALADFPQRGNVPKELMSIGITDFREVHFKPYRIVYRINGNQVVVYCAVDGRRDMQSFLQRRLIR